MEVTLFLPFLNIFHQFVYFCCSCAILSQRVFAHAYEDCCGSVIYAIASDVDILRICQNVTVPTNATRSVVCYAITFADYDNTSLNRLI